MKLRGFTSDQEDAIFGEKNINQRLLDGDRELELITTLRYDPQLSELTRHIPITLSESYENRFFLGHLHYLRVKYGAKLMKWSHSLTSENFVQALNDSILDEDRERPQKIRVCLDQSGDLKLTATPIPQRENLFSGLFDKICTYDVCVDSEPLDIGHILPLKSSQREIYTIRRERNDIHDEKEVLLVNKHGNITEGSITSIAFEYDGKWVTPALDQGATVGVMRSFLLELGYIFEGTIPLKNVQVGQTVLLFNGVIGIVRGTITRI